MPNTWYIRNSWLQMFAMDCLLACMDARKMFFRNNFFRSQPFLKTCNFTSIFEHLPVIVAVCYFSVHKLKGSDPVDIYLFKFNSRNIRKRYELCRKLTINTIESRSDVFTVKCFYCWLWIGKCLSRSSFLCKYYYPKSKDEQMLYLISFT